MATFIESLRGRAFPLLVLAITAALLFSVSYLFPGISRLRPQFVSVDAGSDGHRYGSCSVHANHNCLLGCL